MAGLINQPPGSVNFGFVDADIKNQLAFARDIVAQAESLQTLATAIDDPQLKGSILRVADHLLAITKRIAANVSTTSTTAASTITVFKGDRR